METLENADDVSSRTKKFLHTASRSLRHRWRHVEKSALPPEPTTATVQLYRVKLDLKAEKTVMNAEQIKDEIRK